MLVIERKMRRQKCFLILYSKTLCSSLFWGYYCSSVTKEDQLFLAVVRQRAYDVCEVYQSSIRRWLSSQNCLASHELRTLMSERRYDRCPAVVCWWLLRDVGELLLVNGNNFPPTGIMFVFSTLSICCEPEGNEMGFWKILRRQLFVNTYLPLISWLILIGLSSVIFHYIFCHFFLKSMLCSLKEG